MARELGPSPIPLRVNTHRLLAPKCRGLLGPSAGPLGVGIKLVSRQREAGISEPVPCVMHRFAWGVRDHATVVSGEPVRQVLQRKERLWRT